MGLLDQILDGPQVISEQNDSSKINWRNGVGDVAEMIKMGGDVVAAANRRANLDTSNGKIALMVAGGKAAWHELGVHLDRNVTGAQALQFSGTGWEVAVVESFYKFGEELRKARYSRHVIRKDTGAEMGSVGMKYTAFQNKDGVEFMDAMLGLNGAYYEVMGSLDGGRRVFVLANLDAAIEPVPGDIVQPYLLLTWAHDGSGAVWGFPTTERPVCANTYRIAAKDARGKGFKVKHTKNVKQRIKDAGRMLGFAKHSVDQFKLVTEELVRKPLEVRHYANDVLDAVLEVSQADVLKGSDALAAALNVTQAEQQLAAKSFDRKIKRRGEVLTDILNRYESDRCEPKGSAWAAFNAVTETVDHGRFAKYRGTYQEKRERRFESVIIGAGDDAKQIALEKAVSSN